MAISIDTVYQKVLALANKEQRGYITPQEFNLLANQGQMEIFEQYFYDQNQADRNLKNSSEFSNTDELLDEKISMFKTSSPIPLTGSTGTLPTDLYRLGMVWHTNRLTEYEQLTEEEVLYLNLSPIAAPNQTYPAYVRINQGQIRIYPTTGVVSCNYIKQPANPKWGYVVVNEKALYNAGNSIDFELHESDSAELVYKILSLAGITIAKPGLGTYADQQITGQKTQEKQ